MGSSICQLPFYRLYNFIIKCTLKTIMLHYMEYQLSKGVDYMIEILSGIGIAFILLIILSIAIFISVDKNR